MARGTCPVCGDDRVGVEGGVVLRHTRGGVLCPGTGQRATNA